MPRLALLALTLAVLLVHGWLLQAAPRMLGVGQTAAPEKTVSFVTRTVAALPAAAAPSAQPPVASAPRAPQTVKPKAPQVANQPPTAALASAGASNTPAPETEPVADQTLPEAVTDNAAAEAAPAVAVMADTAPAVQVPAGAALPDPASPIPPGAKLPAPVRLKYQVQANKFPFSLNAELLWQHYGTAYSARLAFSAFGQSRVQTSQGDVDSQGLSPTRFSDKYRTELAAHFNRELGKITFSANTPDASLLAGAQDRLSVLVQLATLIASDPGGYPQATTITLQTAGPREASPWLFTVQAPEQLKLPGGEQTTLKLVRLPRRDYDQKVEVWLAPALDYLPARIRITEHNGDYIDQQWLASAPVP
jgi:hypothetical protein